MFSRALQLLEIDPELGGVIACGFRPEGEVPAGRRIPPHAALAGYRTPWGYQPGLLEQAGRFVADLDLLTPQAQAQLAQRLDAGGCTLVAWAADPVWAHLAERVAFLVPESQHTLQQTGKVLTRGGAIQLISTAAAQLGVEGHQAEWFTLRAAAAIAKVDGRRRLTEGDVAEAVALVLAPRARAAAAQAPPQPEQAQSNRTAQESAEAPPRQVPMVPLPHTRPPTLRPTLHGAPVRSVPGRRRRGSLDLPATLLAALPWQKLRGRDTLSPAIRPQDLRWHLRRPRQGRLVIFVVDASGSMGARRLGQAKGAALALLQQAYRERDQVALITAAGREALLALPPARAVEQARRRLLALPAGGATPLAGALAIALELARRARRREGRPSSLILLSDGRANLPHRAANRSAIKSEVKRICLALREVLDSTVVAGQPGREAIELAHWVGGSFQSLSRTLSTSPLVPNQPI